MAFRRAVLAGLAGTAVMTMLMLMAPLMGMPEMNIGAMLGGFLGVGEAVGWGMHFMIGTVLAVIFSLVFVGRLPGTAVARGAFYGVLVFLLAQLVVMPMMGAGVFSPGDSSRKCMPAWRGAVHPSPTSCGANRSTQKRSATVTPCTGRSCSGEALSAARTAKPSL